MAQSSTFRQTVVSEWESKLINEKLAPEFLGLWFKMADDGVDAVTGKQALAVALRTSAQYLRGTSNLTEDACFDHISNDLAALIHKYQEQNVPYYVISGILEIYVCELLGHKTKPEKEEPTQIPKAS